MEKLTNSDPKSTNSSYTDIWLWIAISLAFIWFALLVVEKPFALTEVSVFSMSYVLSVSGIIGLMAAGTYGWFIAKKYLYSRENESIKPGLFSLSMMVYTSVLYLIGATIFRLLTT